MAMVVQPDGTQMVVTQPGMAVTQQGMVGNVQIITVANALQRLNQRDWSSGICECMNDCSSCCLATWCWPCFLCCLAPKMNENMCGPFFCEYLFMIPMRTKARTMFSIRGSICSDLCCVMCCPCCAMTQIWRELETAGL